MQPNLHGILEQVDYSTDFSILLYINNTPENFAEHWHPSFEIIMPIDNTYEVHIGNTHYNLQPEDILIIPPGDLHELCAPEDGSRLILLFDHSLITEVKGISSILPILREPRIIRKGSASDMDIHDQITTLLWDIKTEYKTASPLWEVAVYEKLIRMFLIIGRKYFNNRMFFTESKQNKQKEYIEKFDLIFEYIHTNYTKEISLDIIADIAGFSKFHFSRLFKQFTNMSFYDYINKERIQAAETLLLDHSLSITDVAFQAGFSSISTFNRVFKKYKNCTPSEFRSLYQVK